MDEILVPNLSSPTSDKDVNELVGIEENDLSQVNHAAVGSAVWRKLDIRVLPLCTMSVLLSAVDKNNIANARLAGLPTSLGMSDYQYTVALTATIVPFIAAQLPSTLLLKHIGPDLMLPSVMIIWAVVAAAQGLVHNYSELLICRFFLGLFEGGLLPCIVLYLSLFYPRERLQIRIAIFHSTVSLAGAFSGLLAAAIESMNGKGGRPGWAWIFILEGIFTAVFGVVSFFCLPRSPDQARFLTEKERAYLVATLKHAGSMSEDYETDRFDWTEVIGSITSLQVWLLAISFFINGAMGLSAACFEPIIVAGLGYTGKQAQLMSSPPFGASFVLEIVSSFISDRYQCRGYVTIFFSVLQVIGFTVYYAGTSNHIRYVAVFFIVAGTYGVAPALFTWVANNSAPHTRRATAVAIAFMMVQVGGMVATWLFGWISPAPDYTSATIAFIVMSVAMVVFSMTNLAYLWRQNQLKAEIRGRMRKDEEPEGLGDRSAWFIYSL